MNQAVNLNLLALTLTMRDGLDEAAAAEESSIRPGVDALCRHNVSSVRIGD